MKNQTFVLALALLLAGITFTHAQGTAFSYQGRMTHADGSPVNGTHDLEVSIFATQTGGSAIASQNYPGIPINNGLFSLTIEFDVPTTVAVFNGDTRWLEVRDLTTSTFFPRQRLTATPYAITASNLSGTLPASQISGTLSSNQLAGTYTGALNFNNAANTFAGSFVGNGASVSNVNAAALGGLSAGAFWQTTGNAGTTTNNFLGTTDFTSLQLRVNGEPALRLQPSSYSPNLIGGSRVNTIDNNVYGSFIGGGGAYYTPSIQYSNRIAAGGNWSVIAGGYNNITDSELSVIGGGSRNTIYLASDKAVIAGGSANYIQTSDGNISGGRSNSIINTVSGVIGGGELNSLSYSANWSVIAGGQHNQISQGTYFANISGGRENLIQSTPGTGATIAGGVTNAIYSSDDAVVGGGNNNYIQDSPRATISGGHWHEILSAPGATIGGGEYNGVHAAHSTVSGGSANVVDSADSVIAGGYANAISENASQATISGGWKNTIETNSSFSTIAGGRNNFIRGAAPQNAISGGTTNQINDASVNSTIAGGGFNTINTNAAYVFIGGGRNNLIDSAIPNTNAYSTITGGSQNYIGPGATAASIGGGSLNVISNNAQYTTVAGGLLHRIDPGANSATIAGGVRNWLQTNAAYSVIAGGNQNTISAFALSATIAGGLFNSVSNSASHAIIGGGMSNIVAAQGAMVLGGSNNIAGGTNSFASGTSARAQHNGAFVWGDNSTNGAVLSTNANSWTVRAAGGVRFFTSATTNSGIYIAPGGGTVINLSDRNAKENFAPVQPREVLEKVAALPLTTWNYKTQDKEVRHIGPMAQDFKAAFGLGETETGIATVDADGVALAAIQGLNKKLEERLATKDAEIAELKKALARIEAAIRSQH